MDRRSSAFGSAYAVLLLCIAVYGFFATGYRPAQTVVTSTFVTFHPAAPGPAGSGAGALAGTYAPQTVELYQTVDFAAPVPPGQLSGFASLFDVEAVATFTNPATGDLFVTEAFYDEGADGKAMYRFRFTPTSLGTWSMATASNVAALAGLSGTVQVGAASDPALYGFLTADKGRFVAPVAGTGEPRGLVYQVFMHGGSPLENLGALPTEDAELRAALAHLLDEAAGYGFDAVFVGVWHQWFDLGNSSSDSHASVEPDPATFRVLEVLCALAHERGMFVHIWQWGDEQRRWSPLGIPADVDFPGDAGGPNGIADRRLQRYIAARLGPLTNWTLGYGFDLFEWADEDQVRSWAAYLDARMARPHLLTALEQRRSARSNFDLGETKLSLVSNAAAAESALATGAAPSAALYAAAVSALDAARGKPVAFENRYLYLRAGVWTMDEVRRSLWALSMAGGVAAVWGIDWDLQEAYSHPEQLLTYRRFWDGRLLGELVSAVHPDGSLSLLSATGDRGVVYSESTDAVVVPTLPPGTTVHAVDTLAAYEALPVNVPPPATARPSASFTWHAPYVSDWALALDPPR